MEKKGEKNLNARQYGGGGGFSGLTKDLSTSTGNPQLLQQGEEKLGAKTIREASKKKVAGEFPRGDGDTRGTNEYLTPGRDRIVKKGK